MSEKVCRGYQYLLKDIVAIIHYFLSVTKDLYKHTCPRGIVNSNMKVGFIIIEPEALTDLSLFKFTSLFLAGVTRMCFLKFI